MPTARRGSRPGRHGHHITDRRSFPAKEFLGIKPTRLVRRRVRWNDVLAELPTRSPPKSRSVAGSASTRLPDASTRLPGALGFPHRDVIERPFESQSEPQPRIHQSFIYVHIDHVVQCHFAVDRHPLGKGKRLNCGIKPGSALVIISQGRTIEEISRGRWLRRLLPSRSHAGTIESAAVDGGGDRHDRGIALTQLGGRAIGFVG
jgi:hypothetical protein